ncbi:MAG: hypothetical protein C0418_01615 [Coriobacteriaceae bacterium]|nr:hypothetical protein [Coriobacteriaceae bacterium]
MTGTSAKVAFVAALAVCVALALVAQAAADSLAPSGVGGAAGTLGRAGFSYLTGFRRFAAYNLWNHIDPQQHEYYGGVALADQIYMMPTVALVTALDPEFEEPYYIAPYILARRGFIPEAKELAENGLEHLPLSGLIRIGYAQILADYAKDISAAARQADMAVVSDWRDDAERHNGYAIARSIYRRSGETSKSAYLEKAIEVIDSRSPEQLPAGAHDHDGDGKPDH